LSIKADKSGDIPTWTHQAIHKSSSDRIKHLREHNRCCPSLPLHCDQCRQAAVHDDFWLEREKLGRIAFHNRGITGGPSILIGDVTTLDPTKFLHPFAECGHARLSFTILFRKVHEHANPTSVTLLRARGERPHRRRSAEQRDELAALHVWMAPAWQEKIKRAAQKSLAVMCPAC
jgi:hypothetical protein